MSYQGTILPAILTYMVGMLIWTGILLFLYKYFDLQFELGNQLHSFLGVALVFLLIVRTNSSYDRYWEGRKQLGSLGIVARNLAVKSNAIIPESEDQFRKEISTLIGAFVLCVKEHLRDGISSNELKEISSETRKDLEKFASPINGILSILGKKLRSCVEKKWMHPPEFGSFNSSLDELQAVHRALDRIRFTPLPFAYVNQLKVFMLIYLSTLPLVLIPKLEYLTLIGMFIAVYAFVGIEEIGLEIEDPFGDDPNDLPIDQICLGAKKDVSEILSSKIS
tara:strand:- start:48 stop:884 length:837 start_codon:yes stop_codon:yes gene_type:complete